MMHRIIEIDYTNHRGVQRIRKILPVGQLFFGSNQWHTEEQWLFNALDMDDPAEPSKTFALKGINGANADKRITDLLTANNDLLQRARDTDQELAAAQQHIANLSARIDELLKASEAAPAATIVAAVAPVAATPVPEVPVPSAPVADASPAPVVETAAPVEAAPVAQPAPEVAPAPAPQPDAPAPVPAADPAITPNAPTTDAVS